MSAVLIFRQSDKITIVTDGSAYNIAGEIVAAAPKAYALPHLNAAVAVRGGGQSGWVSQVIETLAAAETFERIERHLLILLKTLEAAAEAQGVEPEPVEVHVAGFTSKGAPLSYLMNNHRHQPGISPYVATPTGPLLVSPGDEQLHASIMEKWPASTSIDDIDPEVVGLEIMEMQRKQKFEMNFRPHVATAHIVGCFAQATTIWPDRIETKILKRWPDRRGQKIAA